MINAKDRFKEGYVMINRPFNLEGFVIQKMTIFYAFSEQPKFTEVLSEEGEELLEEIEESVGLNLELIGLASAYNVRYTFKTPNSEIKNQIIAGIYDDEKYKSKKYLGEIVQVYVGTKVFRFFPDEYKILTEDIVKEILAEEGYHCITINTTPEDFKHKSFYVQSRGVPKLTADKWVSINFKNLFYYKPYFELLDMFCRGHEIYPDEFYEEKEGIPFNDMVESFRDSINTWKRSYHANHLDKTFKSTMTNPNL